MEASKTVSPDSHIIHWGLWLAGIFFLGLALFIIWGIIRAAFPPKAPLQGQMEARTISIASRVPGRVGQLFVKEGDMVEKSQLLVLLELPELDAKLELARSREDIAKAKESMVDEGARPEQKNVARANWERAQVEAQFAYKTFQRLQGVYEKGLISRERFDEARANWKAAEQAATAARQEYDLSLAGSRSQEKQAAAEESDAASAGVREVASLLDNSRLHAPRSGQIETLVLVEGEVVAPGYPVMTLVDLNDQWATFNLLENEMPGVEIGKKFTGSIPALADKKVEFQIYYISPRASYATWRSSRDDAGYDMKTFEIRARPLEKVEGLRPGMSVLLSCL